MKNLVLAVSALALSAVSASAADMAVKAPPIAVAIFYNWSGLYAGVNGGWAWGDPTGSLDNFTAPFAIPVTTGALPQNLGANHEGGFGGGQVGYNWQRSSWIFGIETDIQGADVGKTNLIAFPGVGGFVPTLTTARDHLDWFGTFRGRVGVAANNVLFYGTGGLAYGGTSSSVSDVGTPPTTGNFAGSNSDTRFGWAAGAGIEWGFAPNWTVKGEYLHIDLGSSNVTMADPQFPTTFATYRFHHELDTVRVGVNYKFGWLGPVAVNH
jgi:outer membrane immunogenic protein